MSETHLIVTTLIATISFAAGFTMPRGYNSMNKGSKQGMPLLITIAAICSTSSVILYFTAPLYYTIGDEDKVYNIKLVFRYLLALFLVLIVVAALIVAFITGDMHGGPIFLSKVRLVHSQGRPNHKRKQRKKKSHNSDETTKGILSLHHTPSTRCLRRSDQTPTPVVKCRVR
ncbi:hypothetical protein TEA_027152 [Camellia sinensis var. sinensis]|uniref:PGG domain-containing protein n=1 Tax=Camellia sinensis var. sinensis TaxID=542762 RepID=A0A4V6RYF2_CAMSN|nr:hypothetical protein TEA_027152 [Camellia sinensis var. sinensis]